MRSKYTHQHLQQEQEQHHHHQQQRSKYLPMLCSSSTKQVVVLSHRRNLSASSSSSSAVSEDPMSPRVGCMGQVKRNNGVVEFPRKSFVSGFTSTTTNTTTSSCNNTIKSNQISNYSSNTIIKYHKLKRFFSTKSLTGSPTSIIATTSAVTRSGTHKGKISAGRKSDNSNRARRASTVRDDHGIMISRSKIDEHCANSSMKNINENEKGLVNFVELDPPLPVVKAQPPQQENNGENMSLWKRRSGGAPLKSLQLQLTQQQSCTLLLQATTV